MAIVNIWAVLVAATVSIILGFLWYGPLFGKAFLATMNLTPEQIAAGRQQSMSKNYLLMTISTIIMAFVMGHAYAFGAAFTGMTGFAAALSAGFWNWLGFVAPVLLGGVLWERKSWKWWWLLAGYYLVSLILQGVVFALM